MKKFLLVFCLILFTTRIFAQQFSQYNTGTLFDSFENPAQRTFIPDSSRQFASNFFFQNIDANMFLTGHAQQTLKNRLVYGNYQNSALKIGPGTSYNHGAGNINDYFLMFKMFSSLNGNEELGFFIQSKTEAQGIFTDESIALFNGSHDFKNNSYDNIFNSGFRYQVYNQFGFSYREQVTRQFAFGIKLGAVSGVSAQNVRIDESHIVFDRANDAATLSLRGVDAKAGVSYLPFSNPGASLTIGTLYRTQDGFNIQANIKDLGFIHWNKKAKTYNFNGQVKLKNLSSSNREDEVRNSFNSITTSNKTIAAYNTPLDGRAELSVNKSFWIDDNDEFRYSPTLIASKEMFYNGFTAAMVNPVQYHNVSISVVTSYDDLRLVNFGGQFMVKTPNAEFFIGSDRIFQGISLVSAGLKNRAAVNNIGQFSGGDIMVGASFKFGPVIEHPMNSSHIPMGEKGFLGRMWDKIFPRDETKMLAN